MGKICKILSVAVFLLGFGVMNVLPVSASKLNFSVEAVIPDNQRDTNKTYFDLNVSPGDQQTLVIHMRNNTDKDVVVVPIIKTATTNLNGVVEYGDSNSTPDDTIPYLLEDLVKSEEEVAIPANGFYDLELEVMVPEGEFDGVLAGGITLQESGDSDKESSTESQGLNIENKYAYVVAILLHENDNEVASELKLTNVEPNQVNARNVINATIQNTMPKFMNQLSVMAEVTKKGKTEVLYSSEKEGMQMAPNTSFPYPISLHGERLESGKYTLKLTATSMGRTWEFTEDFEISGDVAKELNSQDVTIKANYTWLYVALSVFGVLIIIVVYFTIRKKTQEKDRELDELRKENEKKNENQ